MQKTTIPSFEAIRNSWNRSSIGIWTVSLLIILMIVKWQSELMKEIPWGYAWLTLIFVFLLTLVSYNSSKKIFLKKYHWASTFEEAFNAYLDEKSERREEKLKSREETQRAVTAALMKEID